MLKFTTIQSVTLQDWDNLVRKTYGRTYSLQQQDGCKGRGVETFTVPCSDPWDFENDSIPEKVNGDEMGVSFAAWLARDPKRGAAMFWERNFYPSLEMVAQDLHVRGLIPAGEYQIVIDW